MPYHLDIEKQEQNKFGLPEPISMEDWKRAVSKLEGVRLCSPKVLTAKNPKTGAEINILRGDGDAEVYFPAEKIWHRVFRWGRGSARFTVTFTPGDLSHPVWVAAAALASSLGVVIRGEKSEIYNLRTGKPDTTRAELGSIDYSTELREYRIRFERVPEGEQAYPPWPENLGLRSKLGGKPDWEQGNNETPTCSECGEPMSFIGQIDSIEHLGDHNPNSQKIRDQDFMFGDVGIIYVFFCLDCMTSQNVFQCG